MKTFVRFALALALALGAAAPTVAQVTHLGTGIVKKVDTARESITLAHDPIRSLNWPAMTMDFRVRDKDKLATLKPGQKIAFELVEEKKGDYVISRIK